MLHVLNEYASNGHPRAARRASASTAAVAATAASHPVRAAVLRWARLPHRSVPSAQSSLVRVRLFFLSHAAHAVECSGVQQPEGCKDAPAAVALLAAAQKMPRHHRLLSFMSFGGTHLRAGTWHCIAGRELVLVGI